MTHKGRVLAAGSVALALALTAGCGDKKTDDGDKTTTKAEFNAAVGSVFNPSDKKGGTVKAAISDDWDSLDPGDTYYGFSWNFVRLYGRALVMYKPAPGKESEELVGDLAQGLGVPSNGGKTWTYKLRPNQKYEDGTVITSKDVKYAVLRSNDKEVLVNGPTYFLDMLDLQGYKGPYKEPKGKDTKAIETPDDNTIVFNLKAPFGGFDYLAALSATIPVPQAKDTGQKYKEHVLSSGPYMFEKNEIGKAFALKRNPNWSQADDPNRKALPDRYEVQLKVNAADLDSRVMSGDLHIDIAGTGVQSTSLAKILSDPSLKAQSDNPSSPRLWYTSINPKVAPLDNIECRKAIMYGASKAGYQTAYGGSLAGGDIATNLLPPQIPGQQKYDPFPSGADNSGDVDKAKAALTACGQPNGFATNMGYRADRPKEKALAESLQQSLNRVGIKLTLKGYPAGDYFSLYAGKPSFRDGNKLGLLGNGWQADWNDGFGFLSQIVDSRVIRPSGGSSNCSVYIPEVDTMLDQALAETDRAKREAMWAQIDKRVMDEAVILPGVWAKQLTLRGKGLTNVFVNEAFGQYDYMNLGVA